MNKIAEIIGIIAIIIALILAILVSSCDSSSYTCDDEQSRPNLVFINY